MVGSKMPGSFDLISARSYLSDKWGLASGRQDSVLLLALGQQPAARLKKNEDAESFFDTIAQGYLDSAGLSRQRSTATSSPQQTMLDSKVVQQLRDEHSQLKKKIAALLCDDDETAASAREIDSSTEAQDKIDMYEKELGEDFCNGIKPIFKADHQRSYDSVWNWSHVDLLDEYYKLVERNKNHHDLELAIASLRSRASSRLERARQYLLSKLSSKGDSGIEGIKAMLNKSSPRETETIKNGPQNTYKGVPLDPTLPTPKHQLQFEDKGTKSPHILRRRGASWTPDQQLTTLMSTNGQVPAKLFAGKDVLLTGAGPNSIGIVLLQSLLQGGARVLVTTSRTMPEAGPIYQKIFASFGATGSRLVVLPCNQGSKQDIENLVAHIYDPVNSLGWDLDFIIPFAALPEKGREIDNIDSKSELAHRAMLTNVLRIMGAVKVAKESRGSRTRPAQVLLPLSPNHGTFGNDG
ncbi:hypothetical protein PC116_g29722 [Phytophthora cactorum]|nr:hypothetical protein PC116_g29722 [Phytophthora cactorum]